MKELPKINKETLNRCLHFIKENIIYIPPILSALLIIFFVACTIFAGKFTCDFFSNGLFGDGSTYGFVGQVLQIPEPTEPPETLPPLGLTVTNRATITVGGDIMMHMPVIKSGLQADGSYNFEKSFSKIKNYVNHSDYAVLNLETTLGGTDNGREYSGYPKFNCPDEIVDGAKSAGFDAFLTANNHANDTGAAGFRRTYQAITAKGMNVLGTTDTAEKPGYQILDLNGIRIGMIAYTHGSYSASGRPSVNGLDLDDSVAELINIFDTGKIDTFYSEMEASIAAMKADGAEAIVLLLHWGEQYHTTPTDSQMAIAQKMCDLGVDVIAGTHPHVVEPLVMLTSSTDETHKTLCAYSVGNLLSNQRSDNVGVPSGHTEDGILFSFSFVRYSNGQVFLDSAEALPIWIQMWKENDVKQYCILPLDNTVSDWKTALSIDDGALASAKASYERTMAIIDPGLETVQTTLSEARDARQIAYDEDPGVG